MEPFFSIIIPVYNVEKYLEQCVESVLNQDMGDFELILVDDGSADGSGHICDRFAALDSRIKVIHQPNSGHIVARMNGVEAATGEYVLFADSDDYYLPDSFHKIEKAIKKYNCDVLIYCYSYDGNPQGQDFFGGERDTVLLNEYLLTNLHYSRLNSLCLKASSRKIFNDIDISSFSGFRNSEDLLLSLEIVKRAQKISYVPHTLYFYRLDNPASITNNYNEAIVEEFLASRQAIMAELERLNCADEAAKTEFYRAFLFCVANTILQISKLKSFTRKERTAQYKRIADMPFFSEAMDSGAAMKLSRVKRMRVWLLKKGWLNLLYLFDRLRMIAEKF